MYNVTHSKRSRTIVGLVGVGLAVGLLTACSPTPAPSTGAISTIPEAYGTTATPADPANGIFSTRNDGSNDYASVTSEYPQGQAFLASFRAIFPDFGEEYFSDTGDAGIGDNAMRNLQEICGGVYIGKEPADSIRSTQLRVGQDFPREATEAEARAVINAAIDTTCPEYAAKKV
jgi:hypothetical protein